MALDGLPWGMDGNTADGLGLPLRGVVCGLQGGPVSTADLGGTLSHVAPSVVADDGEDLPDGLAVELYRDGNYAAQADVEGNWTIPGGAVPVWTEIGAVPVTITERGQAAGNARWWSARAVGRRACIEWEDQPTDGDFVAYVIYWDEGLDVTPETELARVSNPGARQFRTATLEAGTYRFRVEYADAAGNVSTSATEDSVTISPVPVAVSGLAVTYDDVTRTALIEWVTPGTEPADVRGYAIFDNWHPGSDALFQAPNSEVGLERGFDYNGPSSGPQSFTTPELWAGVWRFNVRGLSELGVLGDAPDDVVLHLQLDGSDLLEVVAPPAAPTVVDVVPLANGAYSATIRVADETGLTALWLLEDGAEESEITLTGAGEYTVEGGTHADGTELVIAARAYSAATVYTDSASIDFTADATAPTGDGEIIATPCW